MLYEHTLGVLGDSQSDPYVGYVHSYEQWSVRLEKFLRQQGVNIGNRTFGHSGDTSTQALARADVMLMYDTPAIGVIEIGVNDPGNGIAQATTQANIQAMVKALKHGVVGPGAGSGGPITVATPSALPANGKLGQRYVVLSDNDSTGGAAAVAGTGMVPTITGAGGSAQSVWEYRNPLADVYGWGRVAVAATAPTACKRIVVLGANYLNFSSGGDTPSTPYSTYVTVRAAQAAAQAAEDVTVGGASSVVFCDLYTFQRNRIVAGTDPNFSADTAIVGTTAYTQARSWHVANSNQHHNAYGHALVAQAILAVLPVAWITALS